MKKADWILMAAICLLAGGIWAAGLLFPRTGGTVTVTVEGSRQWTVSLDAQQERTFTGAGGYSCTVAVDRGAVSVIRADCPDKLCLRQGAVRTGAIVCLPARIVVEIGASGEDAPYDAVTR